MLNVPRTFSKAHIAEYNNKILSKKLNHCIEKAYCQCNWQRIKSELNTCIFFN